MTQQDETLAAYVAGALDWSGGLYVSIEESKSSRVGYQLKIHLDLKTTRPLSMARIEDYRDELLISGTVWVNEREGRSDLYHLRIYRLDDLKKFLEGVFPYLAGRHDAVRLLLDYLIPMMEDGKGSSKEGWLEMMEVVDEFREHTADHARGRVKYDSAYFREEWNMP